MPLNPNEGNLTKFQAIATYAIAILATRVSQAVQEHIIYY